ERLFAMARRRGQARLQGGRDSRGSRRAPLQACALSGGARVYPAVGGDAVFLKTDSGRPQYRHSLHDRYYGAYGCWGSDGWMGVEQQMVVDWRNPFGGANCQL